eukprot:1155233-Pelagomonas_calceolata.AAC.3
MESVLDHIEQKYQCKVAHTLYRAAHPTQSLCENVLGCTTNVTCPVTSDLCRPSSIRSPIAMRRLQATLPELLYSCCLHPCTSLIAKAFALPAVAFMVHCSHLRFHWVEQQLNAACAMQNADRIQLNAAYFGEHRQGLLNAAHAVHNTDRAPR